MLLDLNWALGRLIFIPGKQCSICRVTLKLKVTLWSTWLFLSLLVLVLPRWFLCCFVRFLGLGIHSNYRRLRDHHAWPWNWRLRQGLRDFCYFWLYLSYRDDCFFCFVRVLVQGIHCSYCQLGDVHAWPWKPKVTSFCFVRLKHVDQDGTLRFKVTRDGHANGNSQNEFLDLKTWENKKSLL